MKIQLHKIDSMTGPGGFGPQLVQITTKNRVWYIRRAGWRILVKSRDRRAW